MGDAAMIEREACLRILGEQVAEAREMAKLAHQNRVDADEVSVTEAMWTAQAVALDIVASKIRARS